MKAFSILFCCLFAVPLATFAEEPVSFRGDLAPILQNKCVACHGPKKAEGGYRADSFERAMKEGDSGAAAFTAKDLDDSEAFRRMMSDDDSDRMPLDAEPLSESELALFRRWVEEGAEFDGDDPKAELVKIIPPPDHPAPPESYSFAMPVAALLFSADGKELYVGGYHEVTVWNAEDGSLLRRIENVGQRTFGLDLTADGKLLAVACGRARSIGRDKTVRSINRRAGDSAGNNIRRCDGCLVQPKGRSTGGRRSGRHHSSVRGPVRRGTANFDQPLGLGDRSCLECRWYAAGVGQSR